MTLWQRLFGRDRVDREIDAELRDHVERQIADYRRQGLTEAEARRRALAGFGGLEQAAESCRDVWYGRVADELLQDVRYGVRVLRKSPVFAGVAVLSLALGIGAITAIYSLVDAVLLKTLPVRAPGELVLLSQRVGTRDGFSFATDEFRRLGANDALAGLCAFRPWPGFRLTTAAGAELAMGQLVSGNCFDVLGMSPVLGRLLQAADDRGPGGPLVAVISYDFWQRHFSGDAGIVGRSFDLMGQPFTVVGVTPREFFGLEPGRAVDITVPLSVQPLLLPGTPLLTSARRTLASSHRSARSRREPRSAPLGAGPYMEPPRDRSRPPRRPAADIGAAVRCAGTQRSSARLLAASAMLLAAVTVLLLVACVNLAGLLLARAKARQHEIGASPLPRRQPRPHRPSDAHGGGAHLTVRQPRRPGPGLLGPYGGAGLAVARHEAGRARGAPRRAPARLHDGCDGRDDAALRALAGAARQRRGAQISICGPATPSKSTGRQTAALIAAQTALAVVLVAAGALFVRSLTALHAVDAGFRKERVLLAGIRPAVGGANEVEARGVYRELYTRFTKLAGVRAVTLTLDTPLGGRSMIAGIDAVGGRGPEPRVEQAHFNIVGPRFLETMGVPIVAGRDFVETDDERATPKAIVSASLARRLFGAESAVGRQIETDSRRFEIVGVAADVRYESLRDEPSDTVYFTYSYMPQFAEELTFALRTDGNPLALVDAVRQQVRDVSPRLPLYTLSSLDAKYDASIATERMLASIAGFLGSLALLLVAVGVYGTLAYAAARRTREMGVRLALGAERADIIRLLLSGALVPVTVGVLIGLPCALAASRLAKGMLFGVTSTDPLTFATVVVLLLLTAAMAAAIPARQASQTDPMVALPRRVAREFDLRSFGGLQVDDTAGSDE